MHQKATVVPRQERMQAPHPQLPRRYMILGGGLLRFVLLWDVRVPDVSFSQAASQLTSHGMPVG